MTITGRLERTMAVDHQALSERYATALAGGDLTVIDEVFTEDFVDEYPQSGEVIRGRNNLRAMMENRPGLPSETGPDLSSVRARAGDEHRVLAPLFTVVRVQGRGDAGTTSLRARYPDGSWWWIVVVYELRDGRIARSTSFFAPEFEAPDWRAPFVERRVSRGT
jgi:ketosteroid isomerase-like protein